MTGALAPVGVSLVLGSFLFGLGMQLGGAIGNLTDRLAQGYVTDFFDAGWWPAFNIADSAVVIGTILFALSLIPLAKAERW